MAQRFSAAKRPNPPPRTGRARLQPCHPEPIKKRALAPEDLGRLPRKSLQRDCHPERSEGPAFVGGRGERWFVWHAADQLALADFGWRSASALRKDLAFSTNGRARLQPCRQEPI